MTFGTRLTLAALAGIAALAATAAAQCPTTVIGFNGPPINDPAAQEMFRNPGTSGSTATFITGTGSAFRSSGFQTEGDAALDVTFTWANAADTDSWVRLTTLDGAMWPNPSLHTEGKVRFKLKNIGTFIDGQMGLCLGVRESGVDTPQLSNGGTSGPIEWVGVRTTPSVITAGLDGVLDSAAAGDDVVVALAGGGSAIITGPNGTLDSTAANDDVVNSGFTYTAAGERRPLPQITLPISGAAVDLEWNLATGAVSVNGVSQGGGVGGFTGDGDLSAPNNRGTLEHLAITIGDGTLVRFIVDELQFEAPTSDPLSPPRVVSPILADATMVTVTSINTCVDQVSLLKNHVVILNATPSPNTDVVFTLPAGATPGDVYTATQRDSISGQTTPESSPVTVTSGPPTYSLSLVVDEDGNGSCTPVGPWEFIGCTSLTTITGGFLLPEGTDIFPNNAVWQTIDFDLTDASTVTNWLGGDGDIDPSPIDLYTFDSIWFKIEAGGDTATQEVYIDAIQVLDGADNVLETIHNFEDGVNYMTAVRGQSNEALATSTLSTAASYDGRTSKRFTWAYDTATDRAIGILARNGSACGTTTHRQFTDTGTKIRVHLVSRQPAINALPLPAVSGPILQGTVNVVVANDAAATATRLYVNGGQVGAPGTPAGGTTTFVGVTLAEGDSVSATQTIGGVESDFAYPKAVLGAPIAPATPTLSAPVEDGDLSVNVTGVSFDTVTIEIVSGAEVVGSTGTFNPNGTATVPLNRALNHLEVITVRAVNGAGTSTSPQPLEVGIGNGDVYICIGVRENNDPGPLGSTATIGGATTIEWIGATAAVSGSPIGVAITPSSGWMTLTFDPASAPILGFTGNGIIDVPRGTLEHLALTMNTSSPDRSSGLYNIYIDNVVNVGADVGGADFVLTDFESFTVGQEVLFQEPTFSGTTAANMTPLPASSSVSADAGNPGQSCRLQTFFRDTGAGRWARITTSSTVNPLANPIIDLTRPIRFDLLIEPSGMPQIPGDVDGDGDVDLSDLTAFLSSFGLCTGDAGFNPNADFDDSGCIELGDLTTLLSNFGS